jgi:DNA-binding transcriptional regulator YdaS (Cro superfamily)
LEEWADLLDVEPPKLNKLVLIREAVSSKHLH